MNRIDAVESESFSDGHFEHMMKDIIVHYLPSPMVSTVVTI